MPHQKPPCCFFGRRGPSNPSITYSYLPLIILIHFTTGFKLISGTRLPLAFNGVQPRAQYLRYGSSSTVYVCFDHEDEIGHPINFTTHEWETIITEASDVKSKLEQVQVPVMDDQDQDQNLDKEVRDRVSSPESPPPPPPTTTTTPPEAEMHKFLKRDEKVDLHCPNNWFQCQRNGWGGCCMYGSTCKWDKEAQHMDCWWSCEGRESCGVSCCLDVHTCVNGQCVLTDPPPPPPGTNVPNPEFTNPNIPPNSLPPQDTGTPTTTSVPPHVSICLGMIHVGPHLPEEPWDRWNLAERAGLIIGIVTGAITIAGVVLGIKKGWFRQLKNWMAESGWFCWRARTGPTGGGSVMTSSTGLVIPRSTGGASVTLIGSTEGGSMAGKSTGGEGESIGRGSAGVGSAGVDTTAGASTGGGST